MLKEFKKFLIPGNVVDMAVGFIFGAAFATFVKSLVTNVVMPPIGLLLGKVDFSQLFIALDGNSYATLVELEKSGSSSTKNKSLFRVCNGDSFSCKKIWSLRKHSSIKYKK